MKPKPIVYPASRPTSRVSTPTHAPKRGSAENERRKKKRNVKSAELGEHAGRTKTLKPKSAGASAALSTSCRKSAAGEE